MANIDHIMPKPFVVPIFWGHDYAANPGAVTSLHQMLVDLVTGPFMNGLAQYGVQRGSVSPPIVIDDNNPPATLVYVSQNQLLQDDITVQLIEWIQAGTVPPPPSPTDTNQLYVILPPPETTPETYNGAGDPIGNGIQGWHNEGRTTPPPPPYYYWTIVKTNFGDDPSTMGFVNGVSRTVSHEFAEQVVDRDGSFEEVGDPCNNSPEIYRGWTIQQIHSDWDTSAANPCGCIASDNPVSLKKFLTAIGFDYQHNGLKSLGTATIGIDYIALTMQSRDGVPVPTPGCPF